MDELDELVQAPFVCSSPRRFVELVGPLNTRDATTEGIGQDDRRASAARGDVQDGRPRIESHRIAEQPYLARAGRILKFVFALRYDVVRRHEPRMYIERSWPEELRRGCRFFPARTR